MSVEQTNKVDQIAIDEDSGKVILSIIDPLEWDGEDLHLFTLQEKINSYLALITTGEIYTAQPDAKGRKFVIEAIFKHQPHEKAQEFLAKVKDILAEKKVFFVYGPNPSTGYLDQNN